MSGNAIPDVLSQFLPPLAAWFRSSLGEPSPPQRLGWPSIAAGNHTLILAPTGSGKTLAAFFAALDHLWRHPRTRAGIRILYISPLKALSQDIARNLDAPLAGILETARELRAPLPSLGTAVRTGDTSATERRRITLRPPDILVTTPESLHLMLTSRAREALKSVTHVIVDEIHSLAPNKRGVFLALLLERLEALNPDGFVRIGLSATLRPLDTAARYLGGLRKLGPDRFEPRPVTIIDAGQRKELDLEVTFPGRAAVGLQQSVWPALEQKLGTLIAAHRSTIAFTNNRRVAERLTARLNAALEGDNSDAGDAEASPDSSALIQAHHGSLSIERRRATETALKDGRLKAVIATASLELGIDMGAVDLVCQIESPGSIARGLQRVGRAGHLVGGVSKGRMLAKSPADLLESAALARAMTAGEVEPLRVPANCLDVLAQQVIACVAVDHWDVQELFDRIRAAYPYRGLTPAAFEAVLEMVAGRFHVEPFRDLRSRIAWDRIHNRLHPLPGSAQLALVGGGTIPDTGQFPLHLGEGGPRLGELDEEFVLERRVGETFTLGASTWRIEAIEPHRVIVSAAEGRSAMTPFWRGESTNRTAELGAAVGRLRREVGERLDDPDLLNWLRREAHLDAFSARCVRDLIRRQLRVAGVVPDDRTILVEAGRDPAGETSLAVLSPWGGKLHHALKLGLQAALRRRLGISVTCLHGDDGVLIRLPGGDEPPRDLFRDLNAETIEAFIREELAESALFGLRFRQNAGRALLLPRPDPSKRTPLWLQRLRARDLLQAVRRFPSFPIVLETYRECLDEELDLPRLHELLGGIESGAIRVVERQGESLSPFASELMLAFTLKHLYDDDTPRRPDRAPSVEPVGSLLDQITITQWLGAEAIGRVESRLREAGRPPRSADEMAERLRSLGDLAPSELAGPMLGFLEDLETQGRAVRITLTATAEPARWISTEETDIYRKAFLNNADEYADQADPIIRRYVRKHALVTLDDVIRRYPIDAARAADLLERWSESGGIVRLESDAANGTRWAERRNLEEVRRLAAAIRRRESIAVAPETFADFLLRRHGVHPETRLEGAAAVGIVLERLRGLACPADIWENDLLPRRVRGFRPAALDAALATGSWTWRGRDDRVGFFPRGPESRFLLDWEQPADEPQNGNADAALILAALQARGASFVDELAQHTQLTPTRIRQGLDALRRQARVTNDRFDPLRPSAQGRLDALQARGRNGRAAARRPTSNQPEGRWSLIAEATPADRDALIAFWVAALLDRYGVLCRETAALDPWAPPWRVLYPVLNAAEMRGELRRGYFVEGLSGIQYAEAETAAALARLAVPAASGQTAQPVLVSALDPANLYGSGAPFDIPLLEGGTARLIRNAGTSLVLIQGRPVLIIEGGGLRLTGLAAVSEAELRAAAAMLPGLASATRRIVKIETYNNAAVLASPAVPWLAAAGFVRDLKGMTLYPKHL